MRLFVILDPTLVSASGHSLHYDVAVEQAARRQGFQVVAAAPRESSRDVADELALEPVFRHDLDASWIPHLLTSRVGGLRRLDGAIRRASFRRDLRQATCLARCDASSIVFAPNVTPAHLLGLVHWLESLSTARRPQLVLLLRYAPAPDPFRPRCAQAADYTRALRRLERSAARERVVLLTDSDLLRDEYAACTSLPIGLAPIPHTSEAVAAMADDPTGPRVMTFLGPARGAKGFPLLPAVVRQVLPRLTAGDWQAEFQAHVTSPHEVECVWARNELRELPVTLYERELAVAEYWQLLARSSLVLVPYQLEYYYAQTSGILCEALAAGKPVVVPRGTWMAKQIEHRGVGRTFIPGDSLSLADAVEAAAESIDQHAERARRLAPEWVAFHNPDSFFNHLTARLAA